MKRMGAVLLSVFCVLAAVLVLQTSGQPESGEHVAQAATGQAGTGAAAGNADAGQTGGSAANGQATGNRSSAKDMRRVSDAIRENAYARPASIIEIYIILRMNGRAL